MKAVACQLGELSLIELPTPRPVGGQLVLDVVRSGICGSDLHARAHTDEVAALAEATGVDGFMRPEQAVVMGHEFVGEVVDRGPRSVNSRSFTEGTRVVAMPLRSAGGNTWPLGFSAAAPGAYAEKVVVESALAMRVPNGLPSDVAALTEPMAVALHAVRRSEIRKGQNAVVIGCGPIGLAVIAALSAVGVKGIIASDFSPARRLLASRLGAEVVVDPAVDSVYEVTKERGEYISPNQVMDLGLRSMSKLRAVPGVPWWQALRVAEAFGAMPTGPVVFECVGVPGMIDQIIAGVPLATRVVVVGVCMANDTLRPALAINKEIELRFAFAYTPREFRDALHMMADGRLDPSPLVTGTVSLDGVRAAFAALGDPERHAKILIDPKASVDAI